jgi:chemosensory pili system protein ChpC
MDLPRSLYAVLISLREDALLLPNTAVAEVVATAALKPQADAPPWFAGWLRWEEFEVPVIDFERLNRGGHAEAPHRARIVVVHSMGEHLEPPIMGLLGSGYPHLVTLNQVALQPVALRENDQDALVLGRAALGHTQAAIPDLAGIEAELMRAHLA